MEVDYEKLYRMEEQDKIKLIAYLLNRVHSAETELSTLLMKDVKSKHFKEHGDFLAFHDLSDYDVLIEGASLPPRIAPLYKSLHERSFNEIIERLNYNLELLYKGENYNKDREYFIYLPPLYYNTLKNSYLSDLNFIPEKMVFRGHILIKKNTQLGEIMERETKSLIIQFNF